MVKKKSVPLADPVIVVDELVIDQGEFKIIQLSDIRISKTNRKHFDELKLTEIAASIKEMGVAQPILIRPVTPTADEPEPYEIVAGERRYRGSIIAGRTTIPAMVRVLTDLQAAKIQILENLHREDPHPLEEALGYQNLMLAHGYTADQLADELKKSKSYIYSRLKLCSLASSLHSDFLSKKFDASTALYIARIPVPSLQVQAAKEILTPSFKTEPLSVREAQRHIENRYMLKLADAKFNIKDAKLTEAPNCTKCPKRTGNQPEVFIDINPDVCTDPDCFSDKIVASVNNQAAAYERKNLPVFRGADFAPALSDAKNGLGQYVMGGTWITAFPRHHNNSKSKRPIDTVLNAAQLGNPSAYALSSNKFYSLYNKDNIQEALEKAGYCDNLLQAFDKNVPQHESIYSEDSNPSESVVVGGATLTRADHDPYIDRLKQEDTAKETAQKETTFRVALYKQVRQRGFAALSLDSMRELVKLMLGTFALPDDLMSEVYPFGDTGSDTVVAEYIGQADMQEVQNILLDLVLGEALTVTWRNFPVPVCAEDSADFATLLSIAKAEGINPDQLRTDLNKPEQEEVDATPFKRPLLTLKKKPAVPAEAWPFPTPNSEQAGAA